VTEVKTIRQQLRQDFRLKRKCLTDAQQKTAAIKITHNILTHIDIRETQNVAVYLANDGEIDLSILIKNLWQQDISTYLPVLDRNHLGQLVFVQYSSNSSMVANKYGIAEPDIKSADIGPIHCLDIIFTPLVAFDVHGNRLGMGGGYYDRTLAPLDSLEHNVQLIGLAHSCQQTESLAQQSWDIPMSKIITEQLVIETTR
jgi:5-formyltetrahydrofolate cyclo-ligase